MLQRAGAGSSTFLYYLVIKLSKSFFLVKGGILLTNTEEEEPRDESDAPGVKPVAQVQEGSMLSTAGATMRHVSCPFHSPLEPFRAATATHRRHLPIAVSTWNGSDFPTCFHLEWL